MKCRPNTGQSEENGLCVSGGMMRRLVPRNDEMAGVDVVGGSQSSAAAGARGADRLGAVERKTQ